MTYGFECVGRFMAVLESLWVENWWVGIIKQVY